MDRQCGMARDGAVRAGAVSAGVRDPNDGMCAGGERHREAQLHGSHL